MASREFTAVVLKLPTLSADDLTELIKTIKDYLTANARAGLPLSEFYYWHDDEIPETWGEKFCKSLAGLNKIEAESVLVQAAKLAQKKAKKTGGQK